MKTLKKILKLTFSFVLLLTLFANIEALSKDKIEAKAASLNENNNYLAQTRQRRELSPEQKADVKKRADEQQSQISVQLAEDSKAREKRLIVAVAIGALIVPLLSIFIFTPLLVKSPWYIKPIVVIVLIGIMVLLSFILIPSIL
ncbi:MAG: hypothetical protein WC220_00045 [Pedobacter sp.]